MIKEFFLNHRNSLRPGIKIIKCPLVDVRLEWLNESPIFSYYWQFFIEYNSRVILYDRGPVYDMIGRSTKIQNNVQIYRLKLIRLL